MLSEILLRILKMDAEERQPYRPRPSNAGPAQCQRALVYQRIRQPRDKDFQGRFLQVLEDSSWGEELLAELISKSAFALHSRQLRVVAWDEPGLKIDGSIDGVVTDALAIDRLLEIKNLNHFSFERIWNGDELPENYFVQCALYLRGLQAINPDMQEAILLVKSKNTAAMVDFLLRYNKAGDALTVLALTKHTGERIEINKVYQGIVTAAVDRFKAVEQHANEGTLPDRLPPGGWRCDYCEFNGTPSTCWGGFVQETTEQDVVDLSCTTEAGHLSALAGRYLGASADIKALDEEKDSVREQILAVLRAYQAKKGTLAGFSFSRAVSEREGRIAWQDVPGSVMAALDLHRGPAQIMEVLRVTKKKEGK